MIRFRIEFPIKSSIERIILNLILKQNEARGTGQFDSPSHAVRCSAPALMPEAELSGPWPEAGKVRVRSTSAEGAGSGWSRHPRQTGPEKRGASRRECGRAPHSGRAPEQDHSRRGSCVTAGTVLLFRGPAARSYQKKADGPANRLPLWYTKGTLKRVPFLRVNGILTCCGNFRQRGIQWQKAERKKRPDREGSSWSF